MKRSRVTRSVLKPRLRTRRKPETLRRAKRYRADLKRSGLKRPGRSTLSPIKRRPVRAGRSRYKNLRRRIRRYPWRSRYLRYRRPWRRYLYISSPSVSTLPSAESRLVSGAVTVLRRKGLYSSAWRRRLFRAGRTLTDFINRFYRAEGFELVVRAYVAGAVQRRVAQLAVRAADRLRKPAEDLKFTRSSVLDSRGRKLPTICLFDTTNKIHYKLLPWSRFAAEPMTRLFESDQAALFSEPERTRYLFDKNRVTTSTSEMASAVRRTWREREGTRLERSRRWLEALENGMIRMM